MTEIQYGINLATNSPQVIDRFTHTNPHALITGSSGAGKSYVTKLETYRLHQAEIPVTVIDVENEYQWLPDVEKLTIGGEHADYMNVLNFNPRQPGITDALSPHIDRVIIWMQMLSTEDDVFAGGFDNLTVKTLRDSLLAVYQQYGYTPDPRTQLSATYASMPLLSDVVSYLRDKQSPLAELLVPLISSDYADIFDHQTTRQPHDGISAISLKRVAVGYDPWLLRATIGMVSVCLAEQYADDPQQRIVVVECAEHLRHQQTNDALLRYLLTDDSLECVGYTLLSQSFGDWATNAYEPLQQGIVPLCSVKVLLRQHKSNPTLPWFDAQRDLPQLVNVSAGQGYYYQDNHPAVFVSFQDASSEEHDKITTSDLETLRFREEMERWIQEHAAHYLAEGLRRGFNMNAEYLKQRAAIEFPGFIVDTRNHRPRKRVSPSLSGLQLLQELRRPGYRIELLWYVSPMNDGQPFVGEAIVVQQWLGRYRLAFPVEPVHVERQLRQLLALFAHRESNEKSIAWAADIMSRDDDPSVSYRWRQCCETLQSGTICEALSRVFPPTVVDIIGNEFRHDDLQSALDFWLARDSDNKLHM